MTARYLLPCACGQKVVVEPRQAGGQVRCTCGRSLEVPTMLKMAKLQRAEPWPETQRPTSRWGWHQSIILLGIAILLGTIVASVHLARSRPGRPPVVTGSLQSKGSELAMMKVLNRLNAGGLLQAVAGIDALAEQVFDFVPFTPVGSLGSCGVPPICRGAPQAR